MGVCDRSMLVHITGVYSRCDLPFSLFDDIQNIQYSSFHYLLDWRDRERYEASLCSLQSLVIEIGRKRWRHLYVITFCFYQHKQANLLTMGRFVGVIRRKKTTLHPAVLLTVILLIPAATLQGKFKRIFHLIHFCFICYCKQYQTYYVGKVSAGQISSTVMCARFSTPAFHAFFFFNLSMNKEHQTETLCWHLFLHIGLPSTVL